MVKVKKLFSLLIPTLILTGTVLWTGNTVPDKPSYSLDYKIGSMLMIGFRGAAITDSSHIVRDIREYHLGGVILFNYDVPSKSSVRNITSPVQLRNLTSSIQQLSDKKLFISIDQEGGRVSRLRPEHGFRKSVSAAYLGKINDLDTTRYHAISTARELKNHGINVNFAPLLDLNINPDNPVIGKLDRSFSRDPETVTRHARIFIDSFRKYGIIPVVKHFPGHGSSKHDSHLGVVDVTHTWQEVELLPYKTLNVENRLDMVMTAHIFNKKLDSNKPATLSRNTIHGILREDINFDGVVISDDLQMEAIRAQYSLEETIYSSITAGVDILLFANNSVYNRNIVPQAFAIIHKLLREGHIDESRIDRSFSRIQRLKKHYSLN